MLIFHRFNTAAEAQAFGVSVHGFWPDLEWAVCSSQEFSDLIDPFPFELQPPIVLVSRTEDTDDAVERFVEQWSGEMAGT